MKAHAFGKLNVIGALAVSLVCGAAVADATYDGAKLYDCLTTGKSKYGGQRVNTGYYPNGKTIIRAKYAPNTVSDTQALFCSRASSTSSASSPSFTYFDVISGVPRFDYYDKSNFGSSGTKAVAGNIYLLEIKNGYMTVTNEDGTDFDKGGPTAATDYTTSNLLYLFTTYNHSSTTADYTSFDNGAQVDFYYLKIYELEDGEEVLKHEYVPCKTAAGVIAIADKVTETVLYNGASTQTFTIPSWCEDVYWKDEGTDTRVLTVKENVTYALTATDVSALVSSGRQLVIRGGGTVQNYGVLTGLDEAIVVEDGSKMEVTSSSTITGAVDIAEGTLRIPETQSAIVGNAGLMGYVSYPEKMVWWFDKPSATEIARDYTTFYPHGTDLLTAKTSGITTYRLHGYIWNRATTNETWSFWANFNDRAFVWIDDQTVFSNVASYDAAEKRSKTITGITPGAHEIIMNFTANSSSTGPQWWSSEDGYCGIAIDKCGRGMTNNVTSYYKPLIDPGDGSLLTIDNSTTVLDRYWVPAFTNVVLGTDSVLDCGGHALTVGTLTGFGTVENATTLTVAEKFVLPVAEADAAPLTVTGTLAFADGVIVDLDSYTEQPSDDVRRAIKAGLVVAQATAITGTPTLQPAVRAAGYRLKVEGNTLVLTTAKGLSVVVR